MFVIVYLSPYMSPCVSSNCLCGRAPQVMTQLWRLLIPAQQQSALLSLYTPQVLAHLAASLASKQWRDREAACVALEAFLPTKTWSRVRPSLLLLWTRGMRVLDDVRDSTRRAAIGFMKVLSNHVCAATATATAADAAAADDVDDDDDDENMNVRK
jgi:hypothetical protein